MTNDKTASCFCSSHFYQFPKDGMSSSINSESQKKRFKYVEPQVKSPAFYGLDRKSTISVFKWEIQI